MEKQMEKPEYIKQIKVLMAQEGINQGDLAETWKISRQSVSGIMTGQSNLSLKRFEKLLTKYNYTLTITKKEK